MREGIESAIEALRERGAQRADPVRFAVIESMARRAAQHEGEVRRVLDERLAELLAAFGDGIGSAKLPSMDDREDGAAPRGALGVLVDRIGRKTEVVSTTKAKAAPQAADTPAALEVLPYLRRTWSKLSAEQRLAQSQSALPENAGPLNSHHLVHRSLTLMRDLSPEYFERFVSHVDTLLWIDITKGGGGVEMKATASPTRRPAPRSP